MCSSPAKEGCSASLGKKTLLLHKESAKMRDISLLVPALRIKASNRATRDGQWGSLNIPVISCPWPFQNTQASPLIEHTLALGLSAHPDLHMDRAESTISLSFPLWCDHLPPDTTVTQDNAKTQEPCHSQCNLPHKEFPIDLQLGKGRVATQRARTEAVCCSMLWVWSRTANPSALTNNVNPKITLSIGSKVTC